MIVSLTEQKISPYRMLKESIPKAGLFATSLLLEAIKNVVSSGEKDCLFQDKYFNCERKWTWRLKCNAGDLSCSVCAVEQWAFRNMLWWMGRGGFLLSRQLAASTYKKIWSRFSCHSPCRSKLNVSEIHLWKILDTKGIFQVKFYGQTFEDHKWFHSRFLVLLQVHV